MMCAHDTYTAAAVLPFQASLLPVPVGACDTTEECWLDFSQPAAARLETVKPSVFFTQ
jgi:hypothetical protein